MAPELDYHNTFNVAGITYRQDNVGDLAAEQLVCLQPEPTNPHDPQAIQVLVCTTGGNDPKHIGYVPAPLCPHIHARLNKDTGPGIWDCMIQRTWDKDGKVYATVGFTTDQFIPKR